MPARVARQLPSLRGLSACPPQPGCLANKSPCKTLGNSCRRREAETAALGFAHLHSAFFLLPFKQPRLLPSLSWCVYARSPEAILLRGHTASCLRTGNWFCCFIFFPVSVLNFLASSQQFESAPLPPHAVVWDFVPFREEQDRGFGNGSGALGPF